MSSSAAQPLGADNRRASAVAARFVVSATLTFAFALQSVRQWETIGSGTQSYLIGDWTISYAGGLVRRGFFGSILLNIASDASSALLILGLTQTILYAIIFGVVIKWALVLPSPQTWAPFLLSPAFLLFGMNDFGGTHRKEIIALAGLLLLAESARSGKRVQQATFIAIALFAVAVLSHEANALLVLPFIILLRTAANASSVSAEFVRKASAALLVVAGIGLLIAIAVPGTLEQQRAICNDLVSRNFDENLCDGALSYIGISATSQIDRVLQLLPGYFLFSLPALFAIIPFTLSSWAQENRWTLIAAVAPMTPLFIIAIDWGRWIMLSVVTATVITVVGSTLSDCTPRSLPTPLLLLFVTGWSLPHVGISLDRALMGDIPELLLDIARVLGQSLVAGGA